jgi:hypothetical protein
MTLQTNVAMRWLAMPFFLLASTGAASAKNCSQIQMSGVAVIAGTGRAYFRNDADLCSDRQAYCTSRSYVIAGDRVLTGVSQDGYTCVSLPGGSTTTTGWIETNRLRRQEIRTSPTSSAWEGSWESEDTSIIKIAHTKNGLEAFGVSDWKSGDGYGDDGKINTPGREHHAEFSGQLRNVGNHARLEAGDCRVNFTMLNEFMTVDDDSSCDPNTSLTGIYRRKPKRR